eukprot:6286832-Heterocapsa_arctica.AAC.1
MRRTQARRKSAPRSTGSSRTKRNSSEGTRRPLLLIVKGTGWAEPAIVEGGSAQLCDNPNPNRT